MCEPERQATLAAAIQAALLRLEAKKREAFLLKYCEGMEYAEMAVVTGVGVSALKMRVKRACEAMRPLLGEMRDLSTTDDDRRRDAEWAWLAEAFRKVPYPPSAVVAHAVYTAVHTAVHGAGAWITVWRTARILLGWVFGTAAGIGLVLVGYSLVKSGGTPPVASPAHPAGPAVRPLDSVSAASRRPAGTLTTRVGMSVPSPIPRAAPAPRPVDVPQDTPVAIDDLMSATSDLQALARMGGGINVEELRALGEPALHDLAVLMSKATEAGVPAALLLECALSQISYATPPLVLENVKRRAHVLGRARSTLGADATHNELTAGADALEAGATASQLGEVWHVSPHGRATTSLLTLGTLISKGVPTEAATEAVVQRINAGASDAALFALRTEVAADIARGIPPLTALRARIQGFGGDSAPPVQRLPVSDSVSPPSPLPPPSP
jgi:hypothetical protein